MSILIKDVKYGKMSENTKHKKHNINDGLLECLHLRSVAKVTTIKVFNYKFLKL